MTNRKTAGECSVVSRPMNAILFAIDVHLARMNDFGFADFLAPATIEEFLFCFGRLERNEPVQIILTTELAADIAFRIIKLEERFSNEQQ